MVTIKPRAAAARRLRSLIWRFRLAHDGAIAIEFALGAMMLMALLAIAVDLSGALSQKRDVDRLAAQISLAIAECPNSDCVRTTIEALNQRRQSIFLNVQQLTIGMAEFNVKGNTYPVTVGTMTYLPSDVAARAAKVAEDNDVGIAVVIDAKPATYFSGLIRAKAFTLRSIAIALRAKDESVI